MRIMISTLWNGIRVPYAIQYLQPKKIYFVMDKNEKRQKTYKKMKSTFGDGIEVNQILVEKTFDLYSISKSIFDVISEESKLGNEVVITICEGMKQMALGAMFAAYADNEKVEGIYYIIPDTAQLIRYPLLSLDVRNGKKIVLEAINKLSENQERINVQDIVNKFKLVTSTVYDNLRDLKKEGFIDKATLKITDFGRIALLKR